MTEPQTTRTHQASGSAHPAASAKPAHAISTVQSVRLIAGREVATSLRSPATIWSLVVMILLLFLGVIASRYMEEIFHNLFSEQPTTVVTTLDEQTLPSQVIGQEHLIRVSSLAEGIQQLESGKADALVTTGAQAATLTLYQPDGEQLTEQQLVSAPSFVVIGNNTVPDSLVQQLTITPVGVSLHHDPENLPSYAFTFITIGYGVVFLMLVALFAQRLSQSVVEEKASRIVELLVSTMKPSTILAGKIIGGTVLVLVQVLALAIALVAALLVTGQLGAVPNISASAAWFAPMAVVGFVFYASLYAGFASTVSRAEDAAAATAPLTYLLMLPYLGPMILRGSDTAMLWLSYLPFSSPVAMPLRIAQGTAQWWEPVLSLVVALIAVGFAIWVSGRIYQNSVLRIGARIKLRDALRTQ